MPMPRCVTICIRDEKWKPGSENTASTNLFNQTGALSFKEGHSAIR